MKTVKAIVSLCLFSSVAAIAVGDDASERYSDLSNELEVLSNVVKTTFRQNQSERGWNIGQLQSSYLAGQGAVMNVSVGGHSRVWIEDIENIVTSMTLPPKAPKAPIVIDGNNFEFSIDSDWEAAAVDASRRIVEVFSSTTDQLRELRSEQRELSWQKRELEREIRNMEFAVRQASEEEKETLSEEVVRLRESVQALSEQERELNSQVETVAQEQQARVEQQASLQQEAYESFLATFEASLGDALCRFGAGLRALPNDEHVNVVLKGVESSVDGRDKDRIYVFSKMDIKACVQESIDESELLTKAQVYVF